MYTTIPVRLKERPLTRLKLSIKNLKRVRFYSKPHKEHRGYVRMPLKSKEALLECP